MINVNGIARRRPFVGKRRVSFGDQLVLITSALFVVMDTVDLFHTLVRIDIHFVLMCYTFPYIRSCLRVRI
jgi:hypothetical protein